VCRGTWNDGRIASAHGEPLTADDEDTPTPQYDQCQIVDQVAVWLFASLHLHDVIARGGRPPDLVGTQRLARSEAVRGEEPVEVGHAARHPWLARGAGREQHQGQDESG